MGETTLLPVANQYPYSPLLDKLGGRLYATTPPSIASHYKDVVNFTETPVKFPGRHRRNTSNKVAEKKDSTPSVTTKAAKTKKQPKQQDPQPQPQLISSAPATPIRQSSDPNRYAGPTFHSSPAPNNLPVPKFASSSAPTGSSVEHYFASKRVAESDLSSSANTVPDPASVTPTASSPDASLSIVQSAVTEKSTEDSIAISAKLETPRTSRFGDSVVFKPRRKGLAQVTPNSERFSNTSSHSGSTTRNTVTDLSTVSGQQRRAPAEFDFLFKPSSTSSQRRAPRDFDFLFNQSATSSPR
ncbi:hypothetical protein POJ06DRAFT_127568 [Lipomyces tetrasporus]|uniref:Uncharacterized protein n=1 Tax=Lipomyces tetrasporus TaxID=54092 RepID=A0AAD7QPA2_9ASCO|nr:uncharacterized protein POJ06DRAFT_127568 [Lipomyces tetrasporus]KAJ8099087.1 hypothetical protein POJ06DRAFT_127568 [Lipomyces tetrasporus]